MKKAYYALTGDPITNGHLHVMSKAADIFDELTVALACNPSKKGLHAFDYRERATMLVAALRPFNGKIAYTGIEEGEIAVRQALRGGAMFMVRGLRNFSDFEKEMSLQRMNATLEPTVQTILIPTPVDLADVSSSMVKSLVGLEDWESIVAKYVPEVVMDYLRAWHKRRG